MQNFYVCNVKQELVQTWLQKIVDGDVRQLARAISEIENNSILGDTLLLSLQFNKSVPILGITGPPGAGKSSLISALIPVLKNSFKKIAVLAVDPTSPFTKGAVLGDRLRMANHFTDSDVFIRSLATRGSLGGLAPKTFEICDLLKNVGFDLIIIETVGVGQSEVEVAALADLSLLVLVPESGDDIQALKAGIMEIADLFIINKADRDGADIMKSNILSSLKEMAKTDIPIVKTVATSSIGIDELSLKICSLLQSVSTEKKLSQAERYYRMLMVERMKNLPFEKFISLFEIEKSKDGFNPYAFIKQLV